MIEERILKPEERAALALRALYGQYGYQTYKMSKFEEYDLYLRNKEFLVSDRILTFSDTNGKLMALKPDVTLSIIKNGEDLPGYKQKVCYHENVYRVSGGAGQFREIMQAGLECIGDLDRYDIFEVVLLAAESLALISDDFVLDISHLGILTALLESYSEDPSLRKQMARYLAEKNSHDLRLLCQKENMREEDIVTICDFSGIYGDMESVLTRLRPLCRGEKMYNALQELEQMSCLLGKTAFADRIHFDFSIVNDMDYYNGIVFQGFLSGVAQSVLSGGQYDKLMEKMGRSGGAVGFAIYLDLLQDLERRARDYDVDVLLLYDMGDVESTAQTVSRLRQAGKSVSVQRCIPQRLRYREVLDMRKEGQR